MKIEQFDSEERRKEVPPKDRPKRFIPKVPPDPNYPTTPFDYDKWNKDAKRVYEGPDMPVPGDTIRTPKLEGKVSKVEEGYVYFTTSDGRNMRNTVENCTVIEKLADQESSMFEDEEIDEVSTELLTKYKTAAAADAREADKAGDYERGNKRFSGIVKATKKQFDNDAKKHAAREGFKGGAAGAVVGAAVTKSPRGALAGYELGSAAQDLLTKEGTMGGINRSAPSNDVSYEKVLDEVKALWAASQLNELSVGKLQAYKDAAKSPASFKNRPLRKLAKTVQGVHNAGEKIKMKTGERVPPVSGRGNNESVDEACWDGYKQLGMKDKGGKQVPNCVPDANEAYMGPHHGDPQKLAKAPKSPMQGKDDVRFTDMVQDTIKTHGVKWAFDYYVNKHGLPPRQFQIFAGLSVKKPKADPQPTPAQPAAPAKAPASQSWWQKLRGKLPFEE